MQGTRGGGKTDVLLMDFAQHCGRGFGDGWRGVLFRHTYKQLEEIRAKSKRLFYEFPNPPKFNGSEWKWTWPTGEELLFRHMARPDDYWNYHGHEYPWIGWEELTNWPTSECYESMFACCRSAKPGMPRKYRATCNPFGVGHNWVKARFIDQGPAGRIVRDKDGLGRVHIHSRMSENFALAEADPDYVKRLAHISNPEKRKAWLLGDWNIVAGGYFDDIWDPRRHVLPAFEPPPNWTFFRSFDWGSEKPASVGFWALVTSDGPVAQLGGKVIPRGSLVRLSEWYTAEKDGSGATSPNKGLRLTNKELGAGIVKRSKNRKYKGCVADPSIWTEDGGDSIYAQMKQGAREAGGKLTFRKADNSRIAGWQKMREMLKESAKDRPESPGLWICETCTDWLRTVPVLQRDEKRPDDLDTKMEDHAADETRYAIMSGGKGGLKSKRVVSF